MLRSISFVIEGVLTTQVRVSGNLDGTLSFEFTVLGAGDGAGDARDLGAVFLDLNKPVGGGFKVFGDAGLMLGPCVVEGVDTLGRAATITQPAINILGDFDIGIAFAPVDSTSEAPRTTGFTLAHDTAPLTLDMIDLADFGLRYTGRGMGRAALAGPAPSDKAACAVAGRDALEVIEIQAGPARPLGDDANGGVLAVIDLVGEHDSGTAVIDGFDRDFGGWGRPLGGSFAKTAILDRGA